MHHPATSLRALRASGSGTEVRKARHAKARRTKDGGLRWLRPGAHILVITALLVFTLYGSYHFDVIGFELTPQESAPAASKQPVNAGIASSLGSQASLSIVTVTSTAVSTATPAPTETAVPEATSTAEPEPTETPDTEALVEDQTEEEPPTATPEPEETATPEPTATPQPTAVPATPTPTTAPATATPAVAIGVLITPGAGAAATATPQNTALRAAGPVAGTSAIPANGKVTPYADSLKGNTLGCNGYGPYDPTDPTTAAVSDEVNDVPCGTKLQLCSSKTCITVERKDTCPGCAANHIDLSRRAFELLCGAVNDCTVTIKKQ